MAEISLTQGLAALVDDDDAHALVGFSWYAQRLHRNRMKAYAAHTVKIDGRSTKLLMHRVIIGAPEGVLVDHINGDTLDNRRANLRLATVSENAQNCTRALGPSGFIGVTRHRGKWQAQIQAGGVKHWLGLFDTAEEAAAERDAAAIRLHGQFAKVNSPLSQVAASKGHVVALASRVHVRPSVVASQS